jgi:ribonucleoside-triphosphate reductase
MSRKCQEKTEVWARVCGFFRPVQQWNEGKKQEYADRKNYQVGDKTPKHKRPSAEGGSAGSLQGGR